MVTFVTALLLSGIGWVGCPVVTCRAGRNDPARAIDAES